MAQFFSLIGRIGLSGLGNTTRGLSGAAVGARRLTADVRGLSGEFGGASTNLKGFASTLTKALGGGLLFRGLAISVDRFAEFERRLAFISKTTGLAGRQLRGLGSELQNITAFSKGLTFEGLSSAAIIAGQLGIKGRENIVAFSEAVEKMALTSVLSSEQAANAFARLSNIFGLPIREAEKLSSAITALAANTTATEADIVEASRRIGGAAETIGFSFEFVTAISATLRDVGSNIEVGSTSIVQAILGLGRNTRGFARLIGQSAVEFQRLLDVNPEQALIMVLRRLDQLGKTGAIRALGELNLQGTRVAGTMLQLAGGVNKLEQNFAIAQEEMEAGVATQREFETQSNTLSGSFQRLSESISALSVVIGELAAEPFIGISDALSSIITKVRFLLDSDLPISFILFDDLEGLEGFTPSGDEKSFFERLFGFTPEDAFGAAGGTAAESFMDAFFSALKGEGVAGAILSPVLATLGLFRESEADKEQREFAERAKKRSDILRKQRNLVEGTFDESGERQTDSLEDLTKKVEESRRRLEDPKLSLRERRKEQEKFNDLVKQERERRQAIGKLDQEARKDARTLNAVKDSGLFVDARANVNRVEELKSLKKLGDVEEREKRRGEARLKAEENLEKRNAASRFFFGMSLEQMAKENAKKEEMRRKEAEKRQKARELRRVERLAREGGAAAIIDEALFGAGGPESFFGEGGLRDQAKELQKQRENISKGAAQKFLQQQERLRKPAPAERISSAQFADALQQAALEQPETKTLEEFVKEERERFKEEIETSKKSRKALEAIEKQTKGAILIS